LNNYFINAYYQFGSYLKVFHRILKLLNSKYESNDISYQDYRMYIGILRGQIENYEFYIIFINALFTNRGTGMGVELIKTSFFGDDLDISLKQHFSHPDFLEDVLKEYFIEDTKRYKSIIERKNIRETYKKRNKESNLLSLLKVEYKLDSGKSIQISNGIKS
ncbi:putative phage abortive infection protein, partial [Enterococcus casseliflavus]|nr:putative phage abortive infection protein [Enterococcus casseliflavus]